MPRLIEIHSYEMPKKKSKLPLFILVCAIVLPLAYMKDEDNLRKKHEQERLEQQQIQEQVPTTLPAIAELTER